MSANAGRKVSSALIYLDSSALVKLVVEEAESRALAAWLADGRQKISSVIAGVEVMRAVGRALAGEIAIRRARKLLDSTWLWAFDENLRTRASSVEPIKLRALDAIHVATALSVGPDLTGFVVYDEALRVAAKAAGLPVVSPR